MKTTIFSFIFVFQLIHQPFALAELNNSQSLGKFKIDNFEIVRDGTVLMENFPWYANSSVKRESEEALDNEVGVDLSRFQTLIVHDVYLDFESAKEQIWSPAQRYRRGSGEATSAFVATIPISFRVRYQLKGIMDGTFGNGTISTVTRMTIRQQSSEDDFSLSYDLLSWEDSTRFEGIVRWLGMNSEFDTTFVNYIGHSTLAKYFATEAGHELIHELVSRIRASTRLKETGQIVEKLKRTQKNQRPLLVH